MIPDPPLSTNPPPSTSNVSSSSSCALETPLTGHLESDITLLSSLLNGRIVDDVTGAPSPDRDRDGPLRSFSHFSAVLTIGSDDAHRAHRVHAISGEVRENSIALLVCTENTPISKDGRGSQEMQVVGEGSTIKIKDIQNHKRGKKLLDTWDIDDTRDYIFQDHLRDVFQMLAYLRVLNAKLFTISNDHSFIKSTLATASWNIVCLIHRRAFRKLGSRISDFIDHAALKTIREVIERLGFGQFPHNQFSIQISDPDLMHFKFMKRVANIPTLPSQPSPDHPYLLEVSPHNVLAWVESFSRILLFLRAQFPTLAFVKDTSRVLPIPGGAAVDGGLIALQVLLYLKPVVKFILKIPGVEPALLIEETSRRQWKNRNPDKLVQAFTAAFNQRTNVEPSEVSPEQDTTDAPSITDTSSSINAPTITNAPKSTDIPGLLRRTSEGTGAGKVHEDWVMDYESNESIRIISDDESDEDTLDDDGSYEDQDDDLPSSAFDPDSGNESTTNIEPDTAAGRVLKELYTITAWLVSSRSLAAQMEHFHNQDLEISIYKYSGSIRTLNHKQLKASLSNHVLLGCRRKGRKNQGKVQMKRPWGKLCHSCCKANIHAEAAVMECIWSGKMDISSSDVPIAWNFQLRGTHNTVYAWVPPPGLPKHILEQLCDALIKIIRSGSSRSVTRQSSYDSLRSNPPEIPKLERDRVENLSSTFDEYSVQDNV
ncbi:hypothetical protein D9757_014504 [Collybiopsis confluens]|uniref:Uncharacterized protein n=1 Tax=Collybiopsis confluens TaxID=2823264 RepID=A0A8H5G5S1_9AGAR|nr:hypothetical protein D9757_014504 [Collybiopsis confluens]